MFEFLWNSTDSADDIIEKQGLKQITDTGAIEAIIDTILAANEKQAQQYRDGNEKMFGFFVGQVMKAMQGKGNPAEINKILKVKLSWFLICFVTIYTFYALRRFYRLDGGFLF